ncbi:unnamed protein product [Gongylonema pulchrum]|uniref:Cation_ATPase_N domain-containing protein n=1 Tax=Gongylonema pulchrum TaxID=637853 RepID=A0A183DE95_9BILA|nr:unnamed protein product [Gongylonema pulchrum]
MGHQVNQERQDVQVHQVHQASPEGHLVSAKSSSHRHVDHVRQDLLDHLDPEEIKDINKIFL